MKKLLLGFLFLIPLAGTAQQINGKVFLSEENTPAQFATVSLLHAPDSSIATGVITLTDGGYTFEKQNPGDYFIKVSYVGYNPEIKNITLNTGQDDLMVDTIFLSVKTSQLDQATIVGERLKGKEMVDRTVYSVPPAVASSSNTGYDLLKKIPQVNVDFQNNVTLNGSSNFIIQVDGKQRDREFLARLLPTDIESIEIISNPSGKYEGNIDGIINIILKKESRYGVSGNVSLSAKPLNKLTASGSGSLDYSMGKITFYLTGLSFVQNLNINTKNEARFLMNDSLTKLAGRGKIAVSSSSLNTGFDYYLNPKNNLSFNVNLKPIGQKIDMPNTTTLFQGETPLSYINSINKNDLRSNESSASLFYKHNFDKAIEELTVETSYYMFSSNEIKDFSNTNYVYDGDSVLFTYARDENNLNNRNYFSNKVDFVYPIGLKGKLETGYQFYLQNMDYNFTINDVETDNLFSYKELRNSVYAGLTWNLKKLGFQAMARVENSHIQADSVSKPDYSCILPTVNLQYKFSAGQNLKLTYNRRINRPGIYDMNPYLRYDQNYNVSQGNPDLRPDYRDRLQLTYTWNFGSNYFSPYVYHEFFTGKIGRLNEVRTQSGSSSLMLFSKPYNVLNGFESGGGMTAMLWYVNINARIYKGHYDSYNNGSITIPSVDYFSYSITSYAFAQLGKAKKTTLFTFLSYNGVDRNAQSRTYTIPFYGFGGQQQWKNHNFGIFWFLPLSGDVNLSKTITETPYYTSTNTIGFNVANFIQFSYTYKFNKGRDVKKLNHKVEVESDSKSQTIGK